MKVLVTGAGGFAGGRIVQAVAALGHEVVGTFLHHRVQGDYRAVRVDLSLPIDLGEPFDAIVHAAGALPYRQPSALEYKRSNVDSMENLLTFAKGTGVKRFIYLSTIGVYGEFRDSLITEEADRINLEGYGLTKCLAECLLRESGIEGISLRPPGIIGPGARGIWFTNTLEKFRRGELVTIYSPDFPTRNFVWVDDIAVFVGKLLAMPSWPYDAVNVACHDNVTICELTRKMKEATGSSSEIIVKEGLREPFCLDDTRAHELGYESISPLAMVDRLMEQIA